MENKASYQEESVEIGGEFYPKRSFRSPGKDSEYVFIEIDVEGRTCESEWYLSKVLLDRLSYHGSYDGHYAQLMHINVPGEKRRGGFGTALIEFGVEEAKRYGCSLGYGTLPSEDGKGLYSTDEVNNEARGEFYRQSLESCGCRFFWDLEREGRFIFLLPE